jgi:hypothetical protein
MAETKDDIAKDRDRLKAENEALRRQLAAAGGGPGRVVAPQQTFMLSEGDRQELAARGVVNVGGRLLTADEVRARLPEGQRDVDLGDAPVPADLDRIRGRSSNAVEGVDFIYPSVAPGQIDPSVAGTPGISGPAATAANETPAVDVVDEEDPEQ